MDREYAASVRKLTKKYDNFCLNKIEFQVPYGCVVGFIGENGAGKSTTIYSMLGLIPVEEGEISLLGHRVSREDDRKGNVRYREQVGVVFDECGFYGQMKVKYIARIMKSIYRTWDNDKFMAYLKRFELPEDKKVQELSRGMKMKLSIAAALSHDSRLLILDEATSGLDPVARSEVLDIFREFILDEERAVFISSHIISDIEKIADVIVLIHKGELLLKEEKDKLLENYGIVRCTGSQADAIPSRLVVGREDNAFSSNVLVNDRKDVFFTEKGAPGGEKWLVDRAGIEDILIYLVKNTPNPAVMK